MLLDSVRGVDKSPGMFRKDQNWIGRPGCTMEEASYVPPSPLILDEHLRAWERYLAVSDIDPLIQTAIMHAQFELIHPFNDGNGRMGRLLIPLYLFQLGLLWQPMFYLSEYLDNHRDDYYARLESISSAGDWNGWIAFLLTAVIEQSSENTRAVLEIKDLYDVVRRRVGKVTKSPHALRVVDALFDRPLFSVADLGQSAEINRQTASQLVDRFKAEGWLSQIQPASGRRSEILAFPALLNIVERRTIL